MLKTIAAFDRIGEENAFAVLARANALVAQGRDIINLGIGQPDFRTPDFIVEAAVKALRDGHHGYTPANGILPLREAVAADLHKRFRRRGVARRGDDHARRQADHVHVDPDVRRAGRRDPLSRSRLSDLPLDDRISPARKPMPVPIREENGFAFSAEETLKLITPQTRLLILNSPANPTGGVTPQGEVDKLVAGLEKWPDVAIMSDEIYDHMVYDGETHVCLLSYPSIRDRLILLNGWSKTYAMTGWRLGYAVWPGKLYDYARKLAVNLHSCVNAAAQYAGLAALTGPQDEVAEDGRRVRQAPQSRGRRPEQVARRVLRDAEGRVLCLPQHQAHRLEGQGARLLRCWKMPASPSSAGRTSAFSAKATCGCPTPTRPRTSCKALDRMGEFLTNRKAA